MPRAKTKTAYYFDHRFDEDAGVLCLTVRTPDGAFMQVELADDPEAPITREVADQLVEEAKQLGVRVRID